MSPPVPAVAVAGEDMTGSALVGMMRSSAEPVPTPDRYTPWLT